MCRGHPKHHRCAHTSVSWYYCPSAYLDMGTGAVSPCGNPIMNDSQPTKAACPLQHCRFSTKGSSWMCCQCNQGPNTQGWCTQKPTTQQIGLDSRASGQLQMTCDHGCCENCTGLSPDGTFATSWSANSSSSYDSASSPSSSSDGTNMWVSSPPSSNALSDSGSDHGRTKHSSRGKKHSTKKPSSTRH